MIKFAKFNKKKTRRQLTELKRIDYFHDMKKKPKEPPSFIFIQQKSQYSKFPGFPPR